MQKNRYSQDISIIINEKWNVVSVNYYHLLFDFIYIVVERDWQKDRYNSLCLQKQRIKYFTV